MLSATVRPLAKHKERPCRRATDTSRCPEEFDVSPRAKAQFGRRWPPTAVVPKSARPGRTSVARRPDGSAGPRFGRHRRVHDSKFELLPGSPQIVEKGSRILHAGKPAVQVQSEISRTGSARDVLRRNGYRWTLAGVRRGTSSGTKPPGGRRIGPPEPTGPRRYGSAGPADSDRAGPGSPVP